MEEGEGGREGGEEVGPCAGGGKRACDKKPEEQRKLYQAKTEINQSLLKSSFFGIAVQLDGLELGERDSEELGGLIPDQNWKSLNKYALQ